MDNVNRERSYYREHFEDGKIWRFGVGEYICSDSKSIQHDDVNTTDYSVSIVMSGKLWFKDQSGKSRILKKGDVFQRIPGILHSTCSMPTEEYRERFVLIPNEVFYLLKPIGIFPSKLTFETCISPKLIKFFTTIEKSIHSKSENWYKSLICEIQKWLLLVSEENTNPTTEDFRIIEQNAKEMLTRSWNESLPDIAEALGMSYPKFRRWFKDSFGMSPSSFRKKNRIQESCALLDSETLTITEIAEALDYSDIYCFSKQFKQVMGTTPSEFRKNLAKQ